LADADNHLSQRSDRCWRVGQPGNEFTAECLELAEKTSSSKKRQAYLDLARVYFRLALGWEKGSGGAV
jgi:hypothetical protein